MRASTIITRHDKGGDYEIEVFDVTAPRAVIVTAHGNGVRRWDGKHFFHNVAEHYADCTVLLVDQNQLEAGGVRLNSLSIMVDRVTSLITEAQHLHPDAPIILMGHSMGCAIISFITDLTKIAAIVFVTPGAGDQYQSLIKRYGPDIVHGQVVTTSDGLYKHIPKAYVESIKGLNWNDQYAKLLDRFHPIYCFEAGDEEIVGEERLAHRDLPFDVYQIIPGAPHNLSRAPLEDFFSRLDPLLNAV